MLETARSSRVRTMSASARALPFSLESSENAAPYCLKYRASSAWAFRFVSVPKSSGIRSLFLDRSTDSVTLPLLMTCSTVSPRPVAVMAFAVRSPPFTICLTGEPPIRELTRRTMAARTATPPAIPPISRPLESFFAFGAALLRPTFSRSSSERGG